jgi:hypothetical protein
MISVSPKAPLKALAPQTASNEKENIFHVVNGINLNCTRKKN